MQELLICSIAGTRVTKRVFRSGLAHHLMQKEIFNICHDLIQAPGGNWCDGFCVSTCKTRVSK